MHNRINEFRDNGFVVLERLIDLPEIDRMKAALENHVQEKQRNITTIIKNRDSILTNNRPLGFTPLYGNHDFKRWNGHLPSVADFFSAKLLDQPEISNLVTALLAPNHILRTVAFDWALPGCEHQVVHQDGPEFSLFVNIPLVDVGPGFAPLEIWEKSHRRNGGPFDSMAYHMSSSEIDEYTKNRQGTELRVPAGSVIIRDMRSLHRGTPNLGHYPRPMLSLVFAKAPDYPVSKECSRYFGDLARQLRCRARLAQDEDALAKANAMGRIVEVFSGTDRNHQRAIPQNLWSSFSLHMKSLLRFSCVEGDVCNGSEDLGSAFRLLQVLGMIAK